ncbi:MAG: DegV family protein [Oscillospiraceae bacterium]|nr:DegV family protein [Oscillospiraceae bacterium]
MPLKLITDSGCDFPYSYIKENNMGYLGVYTKLDGKEFEDDLGKTFSYKDFFGAMRNGSKPTTSLITSQRFYELFEETIKEGYSILYIGLSTGLTNTVFNANFAKNDILEKYPNANITIVDSKAASAGFALCVYIANEMIKKGKNAIEIASYLEKNVDRISHFFTVDDLVYLKRGGRVSSTSAVVGSLLNIKPVLYVNPEGKLVPLLKVKGRKKAIHTLCDLTLKYIESPEDQTLFICHADCEDEANLLKSLVQEKLKVKDIIISQLGATIGTHAGPGTLVITFLGKNREFVIKNTK